MALAKLAAMTHASLHHPGLSQSLGSLQPIAARAVSAGASAAAQALQAEPSVGGFAGLLSQLQAAPTAPGRPVLPASSGVDAAAVAGQGLVAASTPGQPGKTAAVEAKALPKLLTSAGVSAKREPLPAAAQSATLIPAVASPPIVPTPTITPTAPSLLLFKGAPEPALVAGADDGTLSTNDAAAQPPIGRAVYTLLTTLPAEAALKEASGIALAPLKGTSLDPPAAISTAAASSPFTLPAESGRLTVAASTSTSDASPASQQVAPALVQLSHAPNGGQITLRLNPGELGHVQVQITRGSDGAANVQVTAERPETLQLLVADQAQLHHALDSAGVPQEGRTLTLSLGNPEAAGADSFGAAGGGAGGGSSAESQNGGQHGRPTPGWGTGTNPATSNSASNFIESAAAPNWLRAGVDISA